MNTKKEVVGQSSKRVRVSVGEDVILSNTVHSNPDGDFSLHEFRFPVLDFTDFNELGVHFDEMTGLMGDTFNGPFGELFNEFQERFDHLVMRSQYTLIERGKSIGLDIVFVRGDQSNGRGD
jgi:hypothetical protein